MSKGPSEEEKLAYSVKLAYIGNTYNTLNAFWSLRSRLALAVIVLSLLLLAIALTLPV